MRLRPLLLVVAAGTIVAWALPAWGADHTGTFKDDDRSRFEPYIERAVSVGLVQGCNPPDNDRFCPNRTVTRGEMAVMLARGTRLPEPTVQHFTDDAGSPAERAIESLAEAGATNGCGEGLFCPDRTLTRGEMATLIGRTLGWVEPPTTFPYFDLVDSPHGPWVAALAAKGGLEPCDEPIGTRMCPNQPVARDEAAYALVTALGLQPSTVIADETTAPDSIGFADDFETLALWDGRAPSARNRVSLTDAGYGDSGLRVTIPRGSHFGADFKLDLNRAVGADPELLYFRYFLRLDPDWAPVSSGKLPGFSGVYNYTGKGGYPSSAAAPGWSARMEFFGTSASDPRARLGYYVYHLGQEGRYGDGMAWNEAGKLQPGDWYCIEGEVQMNTLGLSDGSLRAWVDGTPAFDADGIQFRRPGEPDIRIESFWFNVYYGGKRVADRDLGLVIDEVAVDSQRIGCGGGDSTLRSIPGDFTGDGFEDQAWWGPCPGGACFQIRSVNPTDIDPPRLGDNAWFSLETRQIGISAGDFNGDGADDIVYRGRCDASVQCWRVHLSTDTGIGTGSNWGDGARFSGYSSYLLTGDWDGDGRDDIVYQGICGSDARPCWRAHLSLGDSFADPLDFGTPPSATSTPLAADVDGDGRDDLVFTQPCGEDVCWYRQLSTGSSFTEPESMGTALPSELEWSRYFDIDGDGDSDLISASAVNGSNSLVVRSSTPTGLSDPRTVADFEGPVNDAYLRRLGSGRPVQAIVSVACGESSCVEPRKMLAGRLLTENAFEEATVAPRRVARGRNLPI
ncbi:MAG: FG-GAP-like repeat-containing protein [Acidimicrobiia bacterium]